MRISRGRVIAISPAATVLGTAITSTHDSACPIFQPNRNRLQSPRSASPPSPPARGRAAVEIASKSHGAPSGAEARAQSRDEAEAFAELVFHAARTYGERGAINVGQARGRAEPARPQGSFVPNISTPARGTLLVSMGRVRLLVAQQTNVPLAEATQCRRLNA
jgi:hypothetical protein